MALWAERGDGMIVRYELYVSVAILKNMNMFFKIKINGFGGLL